MPQSKLEKEIAEMQEVHDDPDTPADVKATLGAALKKAKEQLAEKPAAKKPAEKKAATPGSKKPAKDPLADCREIIARLKKGKQKEAARLTKRKKAGKAPALSVTETVKKTAKTVKHKVEDKPVNKPQANASVEEIMTLIRTVAKGIDDKKQRDAFLSKLKSEITSMYHSASNGYKYEAGGTLEGDTARGRTQVRVDNYRTQHFNQDAAVIVRRALDFQDRITNMDAFRAAVMDMDIVLEIERENYYTKKISEQRFAIAVAHAMRAMYFWYPVSTAIQDKFSSDSHLYWPRFIGDALVNLALKLGAQKMLLGGMPIIPQANAIDITTSHNNMFGRGGTLKEGATDGEIDEWARHYIKVGQEGMWHGGEYRVTGFDDNGNVEMVELDTATGELTDKTIRVAPAQIQEEMAKFAGGGITGEQRELIEDQLSNNEFDDDQDLISYFVEQGIPDNLATEVVRNERGKFLSDPFFQMDWTPYREQYAKGGKTEKAADVWKSVESDFGKAAAKNIKFIITRLKPKLSGEHITFGSGGGVEHHAWQLKNGRWILFGNISEEVSVSKIPYETEREYYAAFWDEQDGDDYNVTGLTTHADGVTKADFGNVDEIVRQIQENDLHSTTGFAKGGRFPKDKTRMTDNVITDFEDNIKSEEDVKWFFVALRDNLDLNFHPDTPFADYTNTGTGKDTFTPAEAKKLDALLKQCFAVAKKEKFDIYEVALDVNKSGMNTELEAGGHTYRLTLMKNPAGTYSFVGSGPLDLMYISKDENMDVEKAYNVSAVKSRIFKTPDEARQAAKKSGVDYDDQATMAKGGRPTSAINRDRNNQSDEPWEKNYQRKNSPKHPKYQKKMEAGGSTGDFKKGDKVTFAAEHLGDFENDIQGSDQSREIRRYAQLVRSAVNEVGSVVTVEPGLLFVNYDDQWTIPMPEKYMVKLPKMARGGKIKFKDKVAAIEARLKGREVPSKYRKEYGKFYDKKEAETAARRIAGAMEQKQKMLLGGMPIGSVSPFEITTNHNNLMAHP